MITEIMMITKNNNDYGNYDDYANYDEDPHLVVYRHCIEGWYGVPEGNTSKAWPENGLIIWSCNHKIMYSCNHKIMLSFNHLIIKSYKGVLGCGTLWSVKMVKLVKLSQIIIFIVFIEPSEPVTDLQWDVVPFFSYNMGASSVCLGDLLCLFASSNLQQQQQQQQQASHGTKLSSLTGRTLTLCCSVLSGTVLFSHSASHSDLCQTKPFKALTDVWLNI